MYVHIDNYSNTAIFDKVIAKIKWCMFFASQCIARKRETCNALQTKTHDRKQYFAVSVTEINLLNIHLLGD